MSILNILLLLSILTFAPLTHALEEALGTPTTVTSSPIAVPIARADSATLGSGLNLTGLEDLSGLMTVTTTLCITTRRS